MRNEEICIVLRIIQMTQGSIEKYSNASTPHTALIVISSWQEKPKKQGKAQTPRAAGQMSLLQSWAAVSGPAPKPASPVSGDAQQGVRSSAPPGGSLSLLLTPSRAATKAAAESVTCGDSTEMIESVPKDALSSMMVPGPNNGGVTVKKKVSRPRKTVVAAGSGTGNIPPLTLAALAKESVSRLQEEYQR